MTELGVGFAMVSQRRQGKVSCAAELFIANRLAWPAVARVSGPGAQALNVGGSGG